MVCTVPPDAAALVAMYPFPAGSEGSWWTSLMRQQRGGKAKPSPRHRYLDSDAWSHWLSGPWYRPTGTPGRFLYVSALGVCPGRQGRGLGGGLLAWLCGRADAGGLHCVAEATSERSRRLLEGAGFEVIQTWSAQPDMPYVYVMSRPPSPWTFAPPGALVRAAAVAFAVCLAVCFLLTHIAADPSSMPADERLELELVRAQGVLLVSALVAFLSIWGMDRAAEAAADNSAAVGKHPWAWSEPALWPLPRDVCADATAMAANAFAVGLPFIFRPDISAPAAATAGAATLALLLAAKSLPQLRRQADRWRRRQEGHLQRSRGAAYPERGSGVGSSSARGGGGSGGDGGGGSQPPSLAAVGVVARVQPGWLRLSRVSVRRRQLEARGRRRRRAAPRVREGGGGQTSGEVESYGVWSPEDLPGGSGGSGG